MNILDILSILVPTSTLRKVKMLKVFKMLKETTHRTMSSSLSASTMYRAGGDCAEGAEVST
jgi:hypothetical protein